MDRLVFQETAAGHRASETCEQAPAANSAPQFAGCIR